MFTFCSVGVCALTATDLWNEGILQTLLESRELRDAARLFFSNGARCIIMAVEVIFGCWQGGIFENCSSQEFSVGSLVLFGALNREPASYKQDVISEGDVAEQHARTTVSSDWEAWHCHKPS